MVDDSHSSGFIGKTGRGTHEYFSVMDKVDIITTTFGKALGGASGGCTSGRADLIDWLRQVSRPYLFSNTVAPTVVGATMKVLDLLSGSTELRDKLEWNHEVLPPAHDRGGLRDTEGRPRDRPHDVHEVLAGRRPAWLRHSRRTCWRRAST